MKLKKQLLALTPDRFKSVPYQIKAIAVKDACTAFSQQKLKAKRTGKPFKMSFKSRKSPKQSCFIPSTAISQKDNGLAVYLRIAGIFKAAETLPSQHRDSRLVLENGVWYLAVSFTAHVQKKTDNQGRTCAIDPGVRTAFTFYSPDSCGKIGEQAQQRIYRLLRHLDAILSSTSTSRDRRKRKSLRKASNRLRDKITSLIDELHWKTIKFFTDNFETIVIPPFNAAAMSCRSGRKLRKKSVRAMLGLAHGRFRERLVTKAKQRGRNVVVQCEAYTSKTASWTGAIVHNLGGRKFVRSGGLVVDRDINGARGILLRALVDTPLDFGPCTNAANVTC